MAIFLRRSNSPTALFFHAATGSLTWTDMPAAKTDFQGFTTRMAFDLTGFVQTRIGFHVSTQGVSTAIMFAEYSLDSGSNWSTLSPSASLFGTGTKVSAWGNIPSAAQTNVLIRVVGQDGDGAADPVFKMVSVHIR